MNGRDSLGGGGLGTTVWWRQMRADASAGLVIAAVVMFAVFVVAAAPRLLEHAARADLRDTVASATPEERNVRFEARTEIGAGPPSDPFVNIDLRAERIREEFIPESVGSMTTGEQWVVDTPEYAVSSFPDEVTGPFPTTLKFRYQKGIDERSRLVAGAAPQRRDPIIRLEGTDCPDDIDPIEFEPLVDVECDRVVLPLFEVAITQQTADDMMVEVGDQLTLRPVATDLSFRTIRVNPGSLRFVVTIAGIVELDDPGIEYWFADTSLHRPRITENPDFRLVFAVGLMSPDQYRAMRDAAPGVTMSYSWRYLIDPERVERTDADRLRDDIATIAPVDVDLVTGLPDLLGTHLAQRRLATLLLSVAAVGIAVAALAAIWVLTAVDGVRRRPVTSLLIDRGASPRQLAVHAIRTGLVVVVPSALLAAVAARVAIPETSGSIALVPVALVAGASVGAIVLAGRASSPSVDADQRRLRRVVAEVSILGVAAGVVALVRRRDRSVADGVAGGFDVLVAAAPALVAIGTGLVLVRLVGPISALLGRVVGGTRRLSWFVGVRRFGSQAGALRAPVVAIAIASAAAVFAVAISMSLDRGRELTSWQDVGADRRIDTGNPGVPIPRPLQDAVGDVSDTTAFAASLPVQRFEVDTGSYVSDVYALDVVSYIGLVGRSTLTDLVDAPLDLLRGDGESAVPAMLVGGRRGPNTPELGDTFELERGAFVVPIEVVATSQRFPGLATGRPTVVVDRASLAAATDRRTVEPTTAFLADSSLSAETRALLDDPRSFVRVTSRSDRLAAIAGDPLSTWTSRSVWLLGAAALGFAMVTVAAAAVITASLRRRDLGLLAVLGLERRSTAGVVAIELVPGTALATLGGAAAGIATVVVIGPNLSLGVLTGSDDAAVVVSWPALAALFGILTMSMACTVAIAVRSIRRVDHAMLLRRGDL